LWHLRIVSRKKLGEQIKNKQRKKRMKTKTVISGLLALGLSILNVNAWNVSGVVSCPNGTTASGIVVSISGVGSTTTDNNGAFVLELPQTAASYTVCVDSSTLPAGATVSGCDNISVDANNQFANANFTLNGSFCSPASPGLCWLTGGGTIGKTKGVPNYNFGGVVDPGCNPAAAGGGNWNVVDHLDKLHFKGLSMEVNGCGGGPDKAPPVKVNTIDFSGVGTLTGIDGNSMPTTDVCFRAHAEDHGEPGGGHDRLYLDVYDCSSGATLLLISSDSSDPSDVAPVAISTGNLQIHTSGCSKR
jgi:hypothetical protein